MDKADRTLRNDIIAILIILGFTIVLFVQLDSPSALLAGSLALTFYVAAEIIGMTR